MAPVFEACSLQIPVAWLSWSSILMINLVAASPSYRTRVIISDEHCKQ